MISIKSGVRIKGLSNEILLAVVISTTVFSKYSENLTITSLTDGDHMSGSLHNCGDAVDLRLPEVGKRAAIVSDLKDCLGRSFDVILETDHIHIEYDPS